MKTDYYPDNRYYPWISTVFVDEDHRGRRISQHMIEAVIEYARGCQFSQVYIPSDMTGFYEKYGFEKIGELENYGGSGTDLPGRRRGALGEIPGALLCTRAHT